MTISRPQVDLNIEKLIVPAAGGGVPIATGQFNDRWAALLVCRARHYLRFRRFQKTLTGALPALLELIDFMVVLLMPKRGLWRTRKKLIENSTFATACLNRRFGRWILVSPSRFLRLRRQARTSKPSAFGVRPDGMLMPVGISNCTAARHDLGKSSDGMTFNIEIVRPIRGTA